MDHRKTHRMGLWSPEVPKGNLLERETSDTPGSGPGFWSILTPPVTLEETPEGLGPTEVVEGDGGVVEALQGGVSGAP